MIMYFLWNVHALANEMIFLLLNIECTLYIFHQRYAAEELELEEETDWNVPDHQQLRERDGQQADRAPEDLLKEDGQPLTQVGDTYIILTGWETRAMLSGEGVEGCHRCPETDNTAKGFQTRLYCFYFTSVEWNCTFDLCIVRVLWMYA